MRGIRRGGFTLLELLVVVSILALLLSILLPGLKGARRQAKLARCAANLHSVGHALRMYLNDSNDTLPVVEGLPSMPLEFRPPRPSLAETLLPYVEKQPNHSGESHPVFACPADLPRSRRQPPNQSSTYFETEGASYTFNTRLYFYMVTDFTGDPGDHGDQADLDVQSGSQPAVDPPLRRPTRRRAGLADPGLCGMVPHQEP